MEQNNFSYNLNVLLTLWQELKNKYEMELVDYRLELDNAKTRLGCCNYIEKRITLSKIHIECTNIYEMMDTLRHEVAHAYSYHHNGYAGSGHNHFFYDACKVVGARPKRCAAVVGDVKKIEPKYLGVCRFHNVVGEYHKLVGMRSCHKCSKTFDKRFLLTYIDNPHYKKEQ
jgi:hypothetical protein